MGEKYWKGAVLGNFEIQSLIKQSISWLLILEYYLVKKWMENLKKLQGCIVSIGLGKVWTLVSVAKIKQNWRSIQ